MLFYFAFCSLIFLYYCSNVILKDFCNMWGNAKTEAKAMLVSGKY